MSMTIQSTRAKAGIMPVGAAHPGNGPPEQSAEPRPVPKQALSVPDMKEVAKELNVVMESMGTSLTFSVDGATKRTIVKVLNTQTHEVVRQIPSEEMLAMSRRITELLGVLFDDAA